MLLQKILATFISVRMVALGLGLDFTTCYLDTTPLSELTGISQHTHFWSKKFSRFQCVNVRVFGVLGQWGIKVEMAKLLISQIIWWYMNGWVNSFHGMLSVEMQHRKCSSLIHNMTVLGRGKPCRCYTLTGFFCMAVVDEAYENGSAWSQTPSQSNWFFKNSVVFLNNGGYIDLEYCEFIQAGLVDQCWGTLKCHNFLKDLSILSLPTYFHKVESCALLSSGSI